MRPGLCWERYLTAMLVGMAVAEVNSHGASSPQTAAFAALPRGAGAERGGNRLAWRPGCAPRVLPAHVAGSSFQIKTQQA